MTRIDSDYRNLPRPYFRCRSQKSAVAANAHHHICIEHFIPDHITNFQSRQKPAQIIIEITLHPYTDIIGLQDREHMPQALNVRILMEITIYRHLHLKPPP